MRAIKIREVNGMVKILNIFDFDGTLVRSPNRNTFMKIKGLGNGTALQLYDKWLDDKKKPKRKWRGWFGRKETLLHPIFPRPLRDDMLIKEVADLFVASKNDPTVITWMMTGRHIGISYLVLDILFGYNLLDKKDLSENKVATLFATKTPTLDWKKDTILETIFNQNITEIEMWEDRPEHIEAFSKFGEEELSKVDCSLTIHEVKR